MQGDGLPGPLHYVQHLYCCGIIGSGLNETVY